MLSRAETPPFPIEDRIDADEPLRLKYRYLDLRRPEMTRVLAMRHDIMQLDRASTSTRAGSSRSRRRCSPAPRPRVRATSWCRRRLQPGTFYALPQSPQQLKQLLMVGGQDRYYQIVRCFRDEDLRADRQFEFTQLDVEMSFVDRGGRHRG